MTEQGWDMESAAVQHKVVAVRTTGMMPVAVGEAIEEALNEAGMDGWDLKMIQPVIYNSSTTGYLLLIFHRPHRT